MAKLIEDCLDQDRPTRFVVVPNVLRDQINTILDAALEGMDDEAQGCREQFYNQLLCFFDEHGYIPEIIIDRLDRLAEEKDGD